MLSQELDAFIEGMNERQQNQVRKLLVRLVDFVAENEPLHAQAHAAARAEADRG